MNVVFPYELLQAEFFNLPFGILSLLPLFLTPTARILSLAFSLWQTSFTCVFALGCEHWIMFQNCLFCS